MWSYPLTMTGVRQLSYQIWSSLKQTLKQALLKKFYSEFQKEGPRELMESDRSGMC